MKKNEPLFCPKCGEKFYVHNIELDEKSARIIEQAEKKFGKEGAKKIISAFIESKLVENQKLKRHSYIKESFK